MALVAKAEVEKDVKVKKVPVKIDINQIVKKAKEAYSKKEGGLANQLSTGDGLARSLKPEDYVTWNSGNHWQSLVGIPGIPYGRIVQISGKPDSGKSTHAMVFMKEAQDQGSLVILWDSERKFSARRFDDKMKGSSESLLVVDTNSIIDGVKAVAHLVHSAKEINPDLKILIVWDSVGACVNSTEDKEDGTEDYSKQPGVTAKENAYAIRKLNKLSNKYYDRNTGANTIATLIINQTYANIGSVGQTEKGGGEIYYLSSIIIQLSRKGDLTKTVKGNKVKYGIVTRAKVKKNHIFDGDDCIAELNLVISADGVRLENEVKSTDKEVSGWEESDDSSDD